MYHEWKPKYLIEILNIKIQRYENRVFEKSMKYLTKIYKNFIKKMFINVYKYFNLNFRMSLSIIGNLIVSNCIRTSFILIFVS